MSYDVTIRRTGLYALLDLKGKSEAIRARFGDALPDWPDRPNSRSTRGQEELFHIGPHHWLLRGPITGEDGMLTRIDPKTAPPDISIVRVSDTMTFFELTGPDASEIMSIACPLDLHFSKFADNSVSYSEVFTLKALIMRCDDGFEFAVEQSFAPLVEDYLNRATI